LAERRARENPERDAIDFRHRKHLGVVMVEARLDLFVRCGQRDPKLKPVKT
jgi:hypothetical protein